MGNNKKIADAGSRAPITDRLSWLWLVLGASLMVFVPAQTVLPFVAWLAPVFLLRFSRTVRPLVALPAIGVAIFAACFVAFRGDFMPVSGSGFYVALAGIGVAYMVAFGIDRALWRRFSGIVSTLVFPLASTAVGFLATFGNPIGTAGSEAYSQSTASLLQLNSVTGIWGIVFLMAWFASVVNFLWERRFNQSQRCWTLGLFGGVMAVVLIFGSVRVAFFTPNSETVRVAMLAPNRQLDTRTQGLPRNTPEEREKSRPAYQRLATDFFERTEREARAGAKIVVWSEGSAKVLKEDESDLLRRAQETAVKNGIYLQIGMSALLGQTGAQQSENRAIMFSPDGSTVWDYHKTKITPGDPERSGEGLIPIADTPYGRLATVICQDDLFPELVRQAGKNKVDILLVPSSDWEAVAETHARITAVRAIENGVSIVRPTRKGVSVAVNPLGQTIAAKSDYFISSKDQTLVAAVPTQRLNALYPQVGDVVAYGSVAGILVLGVAGIVLRKRKV